MADRSTVGRLLDEANALFSSGRFMEAEERYQTMLKSSATLAPALARCGELALLSNRLDEAQNLLMKALRVTPFHPRLSALLGEVYYRQDRFEEATPYLAGSGQQLLARKLQNLAGKRPNDISFAEVPARVPFVDADPLPLVPGRVNGGRELTFMIDTGGAEVIIDNSVADQLGMATVGSGSGMFAGGLREVSRYGVIDSLELGGVTIRNVPVTTLATQRFGHYFEGRCIDGVIGTVLLYHFLPRLDFPDNQLILWPRDADAGPDLTGHVAVPFWLVGDHYMVVRGQANRQEMNLLLDSGLAGKGFTCPASTLAALGIEPDPSTAEDAVVPGGMLQVTPFTLAELSVGEITAWQLPASFGGFPDAMEFGLGVHLGGVASHSFLRPYAVTWDFAEMKIYFGGR